MYDRALLAERLETVLEALERIPRRFEGISHPEDFRASAQGIDRKTEGDLTTAGWLIKPGKRGLGALYVPGPRLLHQLPTMQNTGEGGAMGTETDAMKP